MATSDPEGLNNYIVANPLEKSNKKMERGARGNQVIFNSFTAIFILYLLVRVYLLLYCRYCKNNLESLPKQYDRGEKTRKKYDEYIFKKEKTYSRMKSLYFWDVRVKRSGSLIIGIMSFFAIVIGNTQKNITELLLSLMIFPALMIILNTGLEWLEVDKPQETIDVEDITRELEVEESK
ncbi:MAG: hypothetical protein LBI13_03165 [Streptococcaceae bacterium]|jgi:hypothetical protein|nr:hypothetical protein [Streptococcaceae bacterium]